MSENCDTVLETKDLPTLEDSPSVNQSNQSICKNIL